MRAVIQRVDRACVKINSRLFSSIDQGVLVLLGVEKEDSEKDANYILEKTVNLRVFEDEQGKMNLSLLDIAGELMVVSQFTLLGDCIKGRRPSFVRAEEPYKANQLYEYFVRQAAAKVKKLAAGKFQEMMQIELINNGPVTILLESRKMEESDIKIDKDGIWYYRGAHMFRKDILCTFFEHLKLDECGKYFIQLNNEIYYLDVEDTAFVVTAVFKIKTPSDGHEQIDVLLSDDCIEILDLNSLFIGKDNIMYCRIKEGKFTARFTRKSYYQLAEFIEQNDVDNIFHIVLNNQKYLIRNS